MVDPNDIVFGVWDISNLNLADAIARAKVLDVDLQKQRANNIVKGSKKQQVQHIVQVIRELKGGKKKEALLAALERVDSDISPSTLYGLACIQENIPFINGGPQNTFVPGL
ncbi:hypothetical protein SUGI_1134330 [Cryptomeria japonica]|nr:hypothetical protein SUGI_1134330 [Cryptomeria japonica]